MFGGGTGLVPRLLARLAPVKAPPLPPEARLCPRAGLMSTLLVAADWPGRMRGLRGTLDCLVSRRPLRWRSSSRRRPISISRSRTMLFCSSIMRSKVFDSLAACSLLTATTLSLALPCNSANFLIKLVFSLRSSSTVREASWYTSLEYSAVSLADCARRPAFSSASRAFDKSDSRRETRASSGFAPVSRDLLASLSFSVNSWFFSRHTLASCRLPSRLDRSFSASC